jgi:hypothetical protein
VTSRLLDVREGEASVVVPVFAFAFLCVGAQMFAVIASDTLLVSTFTLGALSRFYLVPRSRALRCRSCMARYRRSSRAVSSAR